jgi:hypothetical protein
VVDEFKYLGTVFHSWLPAKFASTNNCHNARRAIGGLYRKLHDLDVGKRMDMVINLYKCCIFPALVYGIEAFGLFDSRISDPVDSNRSELEQCQITFLKGVLKLRNNTPAWIVYRELGMYPVQYHSLWHSIRFLNRVLQLNTREYVHLALLQNIKDARDRGVQNWFSRLKQTLIHIGFHGIDDIEQNGVNMQDALSAWRQFYMSEVWGNLHNNPRVAPSTGVRTCTYHRYFAFEMPADGSEWRIAPYLRNISIPHQQCIDLARFRTGCHDLRIELLKRNGIPRGRRICDRCTDEEVQGEPHFIFDCSSTFEIRAKYPTLFDVACPSSLKHLFTNLNTQPTLASFIHQVTKSIKNNSSV